MIPNKKTNNMRNKNLMFVLAMVMAVSGFSMFAQEATKARNDLSEARNDLRLAKKDSVADFEKFKKDAQEKIINNEKKIAALKAKKSNDSKEVKEKYDKKILALEQKNNELKNKIDRCDETETSRWTSFKHEFNHDMAELGKSIKDLGVDNAK